MKTVKRIGVLVPISIEYGRQILLGVRRYCTAHPGTVIDLLDNPSGDDIDLIISRVECVVASASSRESLDKIASVAPHVVVTSNRQHIDNSPRVLNDDEAVGRMGAEYLLSMGYRQLVFLSKEVFKFAEERAAGFVAAAKGAGAEVRVIHDFHNYDSEAVARDLLATGNPVGVMAASDMMARWLIEGFESPERLVPDRVSVLGVDDDPLENNLSPIEISSVRLNGERIGYEAAALGMRLANGARPPRAPIRIPPNRIVVRRSTSKLAVQDPAVLRALRLIRDRMGELADVSDVVGLLGINRRVLEKHFRAALDSSIARELANARIQRARELLGTTDLGVKEISGLVGLSEPRMLSIVFKRATGESPSQYRSRIRPGC